MRCVIAAIVFALLLCPALWAQQDPDDPGIQDSLIIGSVPSFDSSGDYQYAFVSVHAVTDENIAFYNIPFSWNAPLGGVSFGNGTMYFYPLNCWERVFDSLLLAECFVRNLGWSDVIDTIDHPDLNTGGQRHHIMSFRMIVAPNTRPQIVTLDTCWDFINGSVMFGDWRGLSEITPAIVMHEVFIVNPTGADDPPSPNEFSLAQNYPNPFNAGTTIAYNLAEAGPVALDIYDVAGRRVARLEEGEQPAGPHSLVWRPGDLPSGIYYARLIAGERRATVRMTLLK